VVRESHGVPSIEALEQIYRRRYRQFLRVALVIVGNRDTASEVVQEAFAKAIRARFDFGGHGSLEAWVWAIVVNVARSSARQTVPEALAERPPEVAATNGHVTEWPELRAAIAALPERQRLAVFLRHYADMGYEQIADVLEIERGTVAATLHTAHAALRKQIGEVPLRPPSFSAGRSTSSPTVVTTRAATGPTSCAARVSRPRRR
jgi:RNA polymerase sigma factor (sigma-70 family)